MTKRDANIIDANINCVTYSIFEKTVAEIPEM